MKGYPLISTILLIAIAVILYFVHQNNELIDNLALQIGNFALWGVTLISYFLIAKSLKDPNPNAMIRAKMGGTILKFFSVILMVLAYVFIHDRQIPHKVNIFIFLGIYVLYVGIEAVILSGLAQKKQVKA